MADTSTLGKPGVFAGKLPPLVKRFYLQFALILVFVFFVFGGRSTIENWNIGSFGDKVLTLVFLAFFLTLACKLVAESRAWNNTRYLLLSAGATGLLALPLFLGNTIELSWDYPTMPLLCAGIALLVLTAPFLRRDHTNEALWEYNRATWSGVASGLAITVLLAVGFLGAIVMTDMATGIPMPLLGILLAISMSLMVVWQLLAGMPRQFDATPADPAPKRLARLTNTVIVPVMAAGLVALLLYLVGLFASAKMPDSDIGWPIAGFAIFVVVAHFVSWPLRDTGGRAVRLFHRHYRYALLAPAIVLTFDAGMRVADSGLTEGRYLMLMLAFWLGATAIYHSLPTQRRLVMAPAMLAALLFAASFGPWGATGLTTRLQLAQLEKQLTAYELLVEGKVVPADAFIETEKMRSITATLNLFSDDDKQRSLKAWFAGHGLELGYYPNTSEIMESMGLQFISGWKTRPSFEFGGSSPDILDIEGFSYMGDFSGYSQLASEFDAVLGSNLETALNQEDGTLTVRNGGDERVVFDVAALAQRLQRENKSWSVTNSDWVFSGDDSGRRSIILDGTSESGRLTVRLYIQSINGHVVDGAPEVVHIESTVLWRED